VSGRSVSFTVAIPTHDRPGTLALAVQSALGQTRPPLEVLVVGDGCSEATREALAVLGDDRVRLLDLPKGPGYGYTNRNEALRQARGHMVAWLGDDDLWLPGHLEHVGTLADALDVDLVQTPLIDVDASDRFNVHAPDLRVPGVQRQLFVHEIGFGLASVAHRPAVALDAGGWRDDLPRAGDTDLWIRVVKTGARTAMTGTPSVIKFAGTGRSQSPAEREAQNRRYLERMATETGIARILSDAVQGAAEDLAHRREEVDELYRSREETAAALSDAQDLVHRLYEDRTGLLESAATLRRVEAGGWWRLRGRLLPLLSAARALSRRKR
jgi:glycosyltransferase involved in cell wall biosynthesis